jgi:hypothetical protein
MPQQDLGELGVLGDLAVKSRLSWARHSQFWLSVRFEAAGEEWVVFGMAAGRRGPTLSAERRPRAADSREDGAMFEGSYGEIWMQCEIRRRQAELADRQVTFRRELSRSADGRQPEVGVFRAVRRWAARLRTTQAVYHPATGR